MRASDIAKDGFYWFRSPRRQKWQLARVCTGGSMAGFGLLDEYDEWSPLYDHLDDKESNSEFVGPIEPPSAGGEDREFTGFLVGFAVSSEGFNGEIPLWELNLPFPDDMGKCEANIRARPGLVQELRDLYRHWKARSSTH